MDLSNTRKLALFDLDNTLLAGDSDHAWGEFLISKDLVDASEHRRKNDDFYEQYKLGALDIHGYVKFTLAPILNLSIAERNQLHKEFMQEAITPLLLESARLLVNQHRDAGDFCIIITATNEFITAPVADLFQVDHLLATELEMKNSHFTGNISGIPCYQSGKVEKLQHWIDSTNTELRISESVFYSDSINDLPLLQLAGTPIAVDPDDKLRETAKNANWKIISLRE